MNKCQKCGHENQPNAHFCEQCGNDLTKKTGVYCPNCGHFNADGNVFCENCGTKLPNVGQVSSPVEKTEQGTANDQISRTSSNNENENVHSGSIDPDPNGEISQNQPTQSDAAGSTGAKQQPPVQLTTPQNPASPTQQDETIPGSAKPMAQSNSSMDHSNGPTGQTPNDPNGPNTPEKKYSTVVAVLIALIGMVIIAVSAFFLNVRPYLDYLGEGSDSDRVEQTTQADTDNSSNESSDDTDDADDTSDGVDISDVNDALSDDLDDLSGTTSAYFYDINSDQPASYGDAPQQRAASQIKLFVMAAAYRQVKNGKFDLDDHYTLSDSDKVGGTGVVQQMEDGTSISYRELIKDMITESDNTAANIVIDRIGGLDAVNKEIDSLGMTKTVMKRKLMDTAKLANGEDNLTTAEDLGDFLTKLYNNKLVSKKYDQEMLEILGENVNHSKLPSEVDSDVTVYNKTGEFDQYGVQNDAAIFQKDGKAFVIVVMSQDGTESDQKDAMGRLGSDLTDLVFD